jgi:predicted ArsR family transcriptional regulator
LGVVRKSGCKVRQVLNELERLELIKKEEGESKGGRKANVYHLEDRYRSLIPAETIDHKADLARV